MTKQKSTKRALLLSALSLLLCVSMLISTTYAWFTDSVTSGNNKIAAGNLKIDLEVLGEDGNYTSVRDMTDPIFNYTLWEPGYTEVKTLKIANEGSLALKYQLNVRAEKVDSILANVIDVYMCFGENTATSAADLSDTNKWWKCGTLAEMMAKPDGFTQGKLLPVGATYDGELYGENGVAIGDITATIALHMQESAGNEYQGLDLGNVDVTLLATQFTYEEDSFDDQYDANAEYPVEEDLITDAAALVAALEAGEDAKLGADITLTEVDRSFVTMDNVGEVTLDLNGYTLKAVSDGYNDTALIITNGTTLTVTGNGKFIYGASFATLGADSKLIIENGTIDADDTATCATGNYAIILSKETSTVEIKGGTIDIVLTHDTSNCECEKDGNWLGELTNNPGSVSITGGSFVGIAPPTANVAAGKTVTSEVVNGSTVYTVA